jgi:hypothetical protein
MAFCLQSNRCGCNWRTCVADEKKIEHNHNTVRGWLLEQKYSVEESASRDKYGPIHDQIELVQTGR